MQFNIPRQPEGHRSRAESTGQNDDVSLQLQSIASFWSVRCGQEIGGGIDSADCWYRIVSGAARRCAVRADGRRQIVDLLLHGDFFALTARDAQCFTIEAIAEGTVVACYPRQQLYRLAESDPRVARELAELALDAMQRLHDHILILGRTTTREKVASFLVHIAERLAGASANRLVLPMSRYDIADYLAISVETVSRSLTCLRQSGAITLCGPRRVSINDRDALEEPGYDDTEPQRRIGALPRDFDHDRAISGATPRMSPLAASSAVPPALRVRDAGRSIPQSSWHKPHHR